MNAGILLPKRQKRRKERGPIPYVVSLELAFIKEGLNEMAYEEEVRRIVRDKMSEVLSERRTHGFGGLFEEYDDRVSEIIEEEIAKN